jgi:hypothetical protein
MSNNCPFYGYHMHRSRLPDAALPFLLIATTGNQCALLINRHAPCYMEIEGLPVDWRECAYVRTVRDEGRT